MKKVTLLQAREIVESVKGHIIGITGVPIEYDEMTIRRNGGQKFVEYRVSIKFE